MVKNNYIPGRGDIVWLNFDPQAGHEQKGKRPALVLSPVEYNKKSGLAVFCPITSQIKGYPFEIEINHKKISGVILSDQVKSLDWKIREVDFIFSVSKNILDEVMQKVRLLISLVPYSRRRQVYQIVGDRHACPLRPWRDYKIISTSS